jgi:hypothetical protein
MSAAEPRARLVHPAGADRELHAGDRQMVVGDHVDLQAVRELELLDRRQLLGVRRLRRGRDDQIGPPRPRVVALRHGRYGRRLGDVRGAVVRQRRDGERRRLGTARGEERDEQDAAHVTYLRASARRPRARPPGA